MQSSRIVFPSPQLRTLRCALHSGNARSLRCAQNLSRNHLNSALNISPSRTLDRGTDHKTRLARVKLDLLIAKVNPPSVKLSHGDVKYFLELLKRLQESEAYKALEDSSQKAVPALWPRCLNFSVEMLREVINYPGQPRENEPSSSAKK